ncbi:ABC transporter ATP-binding protein [Streptococcus sp. 19428wC2_LYSM12]|uniref:amino acid ABC transporter ATP-binding/permease protein n=1 Tax=unclassified Streptococcus TaxID=2608887 RepID=UPI001072D4F2|nr:MULTISPECIES: ABC transporter ATP-binding protein [unclassified Streptococcus]MBF0787823.1 ABC transporter ATP-binding protein [Streptococcus sp. 19428wC2_LYSM12]MCQ9214454.1 ABC transporter ATP-binding protein/permease [Streptococcus sp. O1]TFV05146.1 ABC transporter ATP-binding protein [Streptococcus sp. LYSM12]
MAKERYPTRIVIPRLIKTMQHLLPYIGLAIFFAMMGFVTTVGIPVLLLQLAEQALERGVTPSWLSLFILVMLGLLRGVFRYGEHYFGHYVAFHSLATFRKMMFAKLRRLAPGQFECQDSGVLLKMISEDIEALEIFFAHTLAPVSTGILVAVLMFAIFVRYGWELAALALVTYSLLALILPNRFAKHLTPILQAQNQERNVYVASFLQGLKAVKDLLQFHQMEAYTKVLQAQSQQVNARERQVAQANFLQQTYSFAVMGLGMTIFAWKTLILVQMEDLSMFTGLSLVVAFISSFTPFLELSRLPLGYKRAVNAGRNIFALLDEPEREKTGVPFLETIDEIDICNLQFVYPDNGKAVYDGLSVDFTKGGIVGIVGPSGAGKSTLMKLLMRWYDWQGGSIQLNKQNSQTLHPDYLQAHFAYVPQIPQLFKQSIRENLVLGRGDISDEEILSLAEKCQMKERILEMKAGLDTVIDATSFSAGEAQRIELMRALLKRADCYIFDEPTSNLDSLNEALFLQLVKQECRGFVFLISHRESTLACSDQIYRVENGLVTSHDKRVKG